MGYMGYVHLLLGVIYPLLVQLAWGSDGYMSLNIGSDEKKVFVNTKKRREKEHIFQLIYFCYWDIEIMNQSCLHN
jgi:hypothetical protein